MIRERNRNGGDKNEVEARIESIEGGSGVPQPSSVRPINQSVRSVITIPRVVRAAGASSS